MPTSTGLNSTRMSPFYNLLESRVMEVVMESRMMEVVVTAGAIIRAKL